VEIGRGGGEGWFNSRDLPSVGGGKAGFSDYLPIRQTKDINGSPSLGILLLAVSSPLIAAASPASPASPASQLSSALSSIHAFLLQLHLPSSLLLFHLRISSTSSLKGTVSPEMCAR
jgi:hypothetical protein